jgi:guanylate cyclase
MHFHKYFNEKFYLDLDPEVVAEEVGKEFIIFVSQFGYDRMIRVLGRRLVDFLNGVDSLHQVLMKFSYDKMRPPSFFVERETQTGLILHYRFIFIFVAVNN